MYMKGKELKGNYNTNFETYIYNFQNNKIDEYINQFMIRNLRYNLLNIK